MAEQSLIQLQDAYIAKVLACHTGHIRRVRRGAHRALRLALEARGYSAAQVKAIIQDAYDMAELERVAEEA